MSFWMAIWIIPPRFAEGKSYFSKLLLFIVMLCKELVMHVIFIYLSWLLIISTYYNGQSKDVSFLYSWIKKWPSFYSFKFTFKFTSRFRCPNLFWKNKDIRINTFLTWKTEKVIYLTINSALLSSWNLSCFIFYFFFYYKD